MKVKKLVVKNYKRFKDLTIDLGETPKRIIALIGPNGCGKSSVFDAMLFKNNTYNSLGRYGNKDYKYHSLMHSDNYSHENVNLTFVEGEYDVVREKKYQDNCGNTIFSFRSPYRYNSDLNVIKKEAVDDLKNNNYGASLTINIDDKMIENYKRLQSMYTDYMENYDLKPSVAKAKILSDLNNSILKCLDLSIVGLGNIEAGKGTLFFSKRDYEAKQFEFNVLSSGEKEVVDILLDIYLRKDMYSDSVYIIDEPELHINSSIQRKLLVEINSMIPENCQIWIATHSLGFMRALQDEFSDITQIIKFSSTNDWASQSYLLFPMEMTRLNWREVFFTALEDMTYLISPDVIIYCEGKDKPHRNGSERGMDAQALNVIFNKEFPKVQFVSSGGNTELDQRSDIAFLILNKVFPGLSIYVLKDRDMGSGYLKTNKESHRVLKRFELENYLFDKEVIKDYCTHKNIDFDEVTYDMYIKDIINDDIKGHLNVIKNICGIKVSINPDKFKIMLASYITNEKRVYTELVDVIFNRG